MRITAEYQIHLEGSKIDVAINPRLPRRKSLQASREERGVVGECLSSVQVFTELSPKSPDSKAKNVCHQIQNQSEHIHPFSSISCINPPRKASIIPLDLRRRHTLHLRRILNLKMRILELASSFRCSRSKMWEHESIEAREYRNTRWPGVKSASELPKRTRTGNFSLGRLTYPGKPAHSIPSKQLALWHVLVGPLWVIENTSLDDNFARE